MRAAPLIYALALLAFAAPETQGAERQKSTTARQSTAQLAQRALDVLEIQNIMGRYSAYTLSDRWLEMMDMFALEQPDVRQNVPRVMQGSEELRKYFTERAAQPLADGVMHQHAFLSPVIEVAGDGKTAKGAWDSPGVDVGNGTAEANWAWLRYGVDFIKTERGWKIWHLKVVSVWRAPYGGNWQEMVQKAPVNQPGGRWRYNGKGQVPAEPPLPKPYYTFDPQDAY